VLNEAGKPVNGSRIAIFGVSYKPGVGDLRGSPAFKIMTLLGALHADLVYHDPHVASLPDGDVRGLSFDEALEGCDLALIVTAHPSVDHDAIVQRAPIVVDLRGVTRLTRAGQTVLL
jgi:UDP-N-acetyl-D-glucosamine dehydrogenase